MSIFIDADVPISFVLTSTGTTSTSSSFAFNYTTFGAFISPEYSGLEAGVVTVTDPSSHQQYSISFTMDYPGLSYGGGTGMQTYSFEIPTQFFNLVSTDYVEYSVTLYELDPNTFATTGVATESIDLFIQGTAPPPPPPPKLSPEEKMQLNHDANALNMLANALSDLGAATNPLAPEAKLVSTLESQLVGALDTQTGYVNAALQVALGVASGALEAPGFNPVGITLTTASVIDKLAALLCQALAQDPPDGNFTSVYQAPSFTFNIPGAGATANTLLNDSWAFFQDAANMLEASQRYQGAEYASDTASQALQMNAFNTALSAYNAAEQVVASDLQAYSTQLQANGVADINLATDQSLANLQTYLAGLANPLTTDPFLKSLIASIDATAPNLGPFINADVQQALTAIENMQAPALTGSAFTTINTEASQLAGAQINEVYNAVLQRAPTSTEITSQLALESSSGIAAVVSSVVDSPEAQFNVYPIIQIIQLATGNLPTAAQLAGWVPFIEQNGPLTGQAQANPLLDQMAEAFVASDNFAKVYNPPFSGTDVDPNSPVTAGEMQIIIKAATGIAATQTQVNVWVGLGLTIDQVFVDFALGDQYTAFSQAGNQQYLTSVADAAAGIQASASIVGSAAASSVAHAA